VSIVATPVGVWLTGGRRRLPALAGTVILGGLLLTLVPHLPIGRLLPLLVVYQMLLLASFAMCEVAMMERSAPAVRGRVVGLYLTVAGTMGAVAPWVIGYWTDKLGPRADHPSGYMLPFAVMGGMMVLAAGAVRLIGRLGRVEAREESVAMVVEVS
jgi:MFS family permease